MKRTTNLYFVYDPHIVRISIVLVLNYQTTDYHVPNYGAEKKRILLEHLLKMRCSHQLQGNPQKAAIT